MAVPTAPTLQVRPAHDRVVAGERIGGRLAGFQGVVEVALLRRERSPAREHVATCASATLRAGTAGAYRLDVPAGLPPTAAGTRCALDYLIRAKEALGDGRRAWAPVTVSAAGRPHLERAAALADRPIAQAAARRFHLELAGADLRGGGTISGRLHRHGRWPRGALTVALSCVETWRVLPPALGGLPRWERGVVWRARASLAGDPDRTWLPFAFDVPPGLPPAVEAETFAWRYELGAHRRGWGGFDECAALTPLLFECA